MNMLLILLVTGLIFLIVGIVVRLGWFKPLFLAKGIPILMPRALQNISIPLGFVLLAIVFTDFAPTVQLRQMLFVWGVGPLFIASLIMAVWSPRWLRPRWLVYLEDEYGSVMWHLLDEAEEDVRGWTRRVRTQARLEEWAEETRKKLGYPPHPGQIEREAKKQERK